MDLGTLQIPMICAAFFVIASVILGLIYKFGMKEKSYEEALAEQRHSTQSLLGIKQKSKEKKIKKPSKKTKDLDPDIKKKGPANQEVKANPKTDKTRTDDQLQKQNDGTKSKNIANKLILNKDDNSTDSTISPPEIVKEKPTVQKKVEISNNSNKQKSNVNKKEQLKTESVKEKTVSTNKELPKKELTSVKIKVESVQDVQVLNSDEKIKQSLKKVNKGSTEELKLDDKREEALVKEVPKQDDKKIVQTKVSKSNLVIQNPVVKETSEKSNTVSKLPLPNGYIVNPPKDKRKKRELNALQQLATAQGEPGLAFILNVINSTELSHADVQVLINLLLNKQLDAPKILDDWSEGKSDPVQKLKKQLAEKEKALKDEQETLTGVQIKLKEVRNEQLAERTSFNQKIKMLEEQLQNQQMDLLACNGRCHAQGQQLQQNQAQLNDERMKLHALREELNAVQMQRQQLEMHIAQESEVMIAQLRADIQEYSARNEQMLIDINTIQKVAADNEASYIAQLSNMTQELGDKSRQIEELHMELASKNEMLYRQDGELKSEMAQMNSVMQRQADEIRQTEQNNKEIMDELNNLKKQKTISNKVIAQLKEEIEKLQEAQAQPEASNSQLEVEYVKKLYREREDKHKSEIDSKLNIISKLETDLEEQKTKNNELQTELASKNETLSRQDGELKLEIANMNSVIQQQADEIKKTEHNNKEIMDELNSLKKQKTISNKVIAQLKGEIEELQEFKTKQQASIENNKMNETEALNWKNELALVKNLSKEKENTHKSEIDSKLNMISKLEADLEEQKTKNNELRNKNYKIMEALNAAEVRIKTIQDESTVKEKNSSEKKTDHVDSHKKFLSRLLPEVNGLEDISTDRWEEECSKLVNDYLETLKKKASNESTENLKEKVEHYQNVIKSSEEMLAKLRLNVDQEQISWKAQIKNKDLELEALKQKLEKSQNIEAINGSSFEGQ